MAVGRMATAGAMAPRGGCATLGSRWRRLGLAAALGLGLAAASCGPPPTTQPVANDGSAPPAVTDNAKPAAEEPPDPELARLPGRVHTVQAGETLYSITAKYYGDGKHWRKILVANRNRLSDPQDLRVGMKLIVP